MQEITIAHPSDAGQRLDKFLKKYLPSAPLGGIYKMLRTGKIKVNKKKKDQTYKLDLDDTIQFFLSDEEMQSLKSEVGSMKMEKSQESGVRSSELSVLFEDDYLMVVNKPAGVNVHPGDHKTTEVSLIELVQDYLSGKHDSLTFRPALVHRIDRDTSGCVLIAKEKKALEILLAQLQSHEIEKVYHTIVLGRPKKPYDTIRAKILRIENAKDEAKVRIDEKGQNAVTHYMVCSTWYVVHGTKQENLVPRTKNQEPSTPFSLLECRIETGRTHQIRVHLAHIGYPILGDKAYGNISVNSFIRRKLGVSRQLLHAFRLSFIHPETKKELIVEAPYPEDFEKLINKE